MKTTSAAALACLALAAASTGACAVEGDIPVHPALTDRFYFGLGAFFPSTTTSAQLDSTRFGVGTNIDFENALGMTTSKTVPVGFGRMRFGERWRVEVEYFELNRSGNRQIDRTIQWGDQSFPINAQVQSRFNFSDLRVSAGYSFFRTTDKEIGAGFGVHAAKYDVGLSATALGNAIGSESEKVTAPLPVISFYGQFALTEHWAVSGRIDRFSLSYDKYDGNITGMGVDVLYQPFRNVGFGLGTRALYFKLTATDNEKKAKFQQSFQGPVLFMNVSF